MGFAAVSLFAALLVGAALMTFVDIEDFVDEDTIADLLDEYDIDPDFLLEIAPIDLSQTVQAGLSGDPPPPMT